MPPAVFVQATTDDNGGLDFLALAVPPRTRARSPLIAVLVVPDGSLLDDIPDGWDLLTTLALGGTSIYVLRRIADGSEGLSVTFGLDSTPGDTAYAAMMLIRQLDAGAPAGAGSTNAVAASTSWVAPARSPTFYSDLVVLVYCAIGADPGDFTLPAGAVHFATVFTAQGRLTIAGITPESTGTTGTKTATTAVAGSGFAASFLLAADAVKGADKRLAFDPPGAIGLPSEGV